MIDNTDIQSYPQHRAVAGDEIGRFGDGTSSLKTATESVEIPLADVGAAVPETATVDVTIRSVGADHLVLEIERREDVFILEGAAAAELTGVVGRDERPQRVPDWIPAVANLFGIDEVTL